MSLKNKRRERRSKGGGRRTLSQVKKWNTQGVDPLSPLLPPPALWRAVLPRVLVDDSAGLSVAARTQHGSVRPRIQCEGRGRRTAAAAGQQQAEGEEEEDEDTHKHKTLYMWVRQGRDTRTSAGWSGNFKGQVHSFSGLCYNRSQWANVTTGFNPAKHLMVKRRKDHFHWSTA